MSGGVQMSIAERNARRRVLRGTASAAAAWAASSSNAADVLKFAPIQTIGPFYPVQKPQDIDADLTRRAGTAGSRLIARVERMATGPNAGLLVARWDIVLESGRS